MIEYRKYRGKTAKEARIKWAVDTVGKETYLLKENIVKIGGFLGLGGHNEYELTVSIMEIKETNKKKSKKDENSDNQHQETMNAAMDVIVKNSEERKQKLLKKEKKQQQSQYNTFEKEIVTQPKTDPAYNDIKIELQQLKELVYTFITKKPIEEDITIDGDIPIKIDDKEEKNDDKAFSFIELFKVFLKNKEFDETFIDNLIEEYKIDEVKIRNYEQGIDEIIMFVKKYLNENLVVEGLSLKDVEPNLVFFVGPTGIGKTTTVAKVGANLGIFDKKKVKFISIDNFRIGGTQQLKLYADWMEVPFEKFDRMEDFKHSLGYDNDFDLILVDTPGHSPKNNKEIDKLKRYINSVKNLEVHVCLLISATTKYKDLIEILERYATLNYDGIVLTKMDETNSLGQIASALISQDKKLSYLCFGQNVPEDFETVTLDGIVDKIVKSIY